MSAYHRLISYIYAYEGGIKGKNTGFAKLETRGTSCRIQVSVRRVFAGGSPIGVYLLAGQDEIRIGTLFVRGGNGEFRTVVNCENIEGSGCKMEECCGLTLHETDSAWRAYTTIWEDAVAHAAEVELADVTAEKVREREAEKEAATRKLAERARKATEKEAEILAKNEKPSHFESVCVMEEPGAFKTETESPAVIDEIKSILEGVTRGEESKSGKAAAPVASGSGEEKTEEEIGLETLEAGRGEEDEGKSVETAERSEIGNWPEMKESAERQKEAGENRVSEEERIEGSIDSEVSEGRGEEGNGAPEESLDRSSVEISWQGEADRVGEDEKMRVQEGAEPALPVGEKALQKGSETLSGEMSSREGGEPVPLSGEAPSQDEAAHGPSSGEMPSQGAPARMPSSEKISPQKESDAASTSQEAASQRPSRASESQEESSSRGESLWNRLRATYPKVTAFECTDGCEILVIKPQDIGLLPRENWVYGNNSFLLHGYYNYRYLILARLGKSGERGRYILGVPGHYGNNEKYMAAMFGFNRFVRSTRQPPRDSRFGYWYTDLNFA